MASKNTTNTTASKNGRQRIERSNSDSARWIAGLLLLFVGVFAASSVLFSFFSWAADQSGLQLSPEERLTLGVEPEKNQPMFICHANCPESVAFVKALLKERFGVTDVRADFIGPVIGSHTGCGTLGLFFLGTER